MGVGLGNERKHEVKGEVRGPCTTRGWRCDLNEDRIHLLLRFEGWGR